MIIALVPILMVLAGALIYGLSDNAKMAELGRLCAGAGFIGLAIAYAGHLVTLGR